MHSKLILDLGKCPNQKVKVHVFWFGHFLWSKILLESSFAQKYYIITDLKFFLRVSDVESLKKKNNAWKRMQVKAVWFWPRRSKKKFRAVIIQHFWAKLLSKLILDLGKWPNQKVKVQVFWFGRFLWSKIILESSSAQKWYIITVLNFFLESFSSCALSSPRSTPQEPRIHRCD